MTAMPGFEDAALSPRGCEAVVNAWSERLGVPTPWFDAAGSRLVERESMEAVVSVTFAATHVVLGPGRALGLLAPWSGTEHLEPSMMMSLLAELQPREVGTATLSFRDAEMPTRGEAEAGTPEAIAAVRGEASDAEWAESGLADMSDRWVVRGRDGAPASVAGYEPWAGSLAHLGVLTSSLHRGRGYGGAAVAHAASRAIATHGVAQWRASRSNALSQGLAHRLGFVEMGMQSAVALG
ncbi:GNAT family N-acetyltransferase [Demequina globuliformis]|uniref:GNAT family N-acetyltransferase n=1 Tax=Demequina globuliformis TaxID=676202 RepID=UPI0007813391|nr:GNAT family N-acetyltransferase [Demequina globuliformis]